MNPILNLIRIRGMGGVHIRAGPAGWHVVITIDGIEAEGVGPTYAEAAHTAVASWYSLDYHRMREREREAP